MIQWLGLCKLSLLRAQVRSLVGKLKILQAMQHYQKKRFEQHYLVIHLDVKVKEESEIKNVQESQLWYTVSKKSYS